MGCVTFFFPPFFLSSFKRPLQKLIWALCIIERGELGFVSFYLKLRFFQSFEIFWISLRANHHCEFHLLLSKIKIHANFDHFTLALFSHFCKIHCIRTQKPSLFKIKISSIFSFEKKVIKRKFHSSLKISVIFHACQSNWSKAIWGDLKWNLIPDDKLSDPRCTSQLLQARLYVESFEMRYYF